MGFYTISPGYLIKLLQAAAMPFLSLLKEVGCVHVCSIMHELWMPTQETSDVDGPCGGRETLPFLGMSFYTVQTFPTGRY